MEIMVPVDKPPLPHPHSHFASRVRALGILAYIGFVLLLSMILAEGRISFFFLVPSLELIGLGFVGLVVTWRVVRLGGAVLVLAMTLALWVAPKELLEWRPWFYGVEGFTALIGILLLFAPRAASRKQSGTTT